MSTSFSAHISDDEREKLRTYQEGYDLKNTAAVLKHLVKHATMPEPKKKKSEPDPNQTTL